MALPPSEATRLLLERTSATTGEAFLSALARAAADALGTRYGLVGTTIPGTERVQVLAAFDGPTALPPFDYGLAGSPCEHVFSTGAVCHYPSGVAELFPQDTMLADMKIQSYLGIPVHDGHEAIGLIIGLDPAPTESHPEVETILQLFAQRAAAEIARIDAQLALYKSQARHRQIISSCLDGIWTIDAEGRTTYVNDPMARMLGTSPERMLGTSVFEFMDDEGRAAAKANLARGASGVAERLEFRFVRPDGTSVWTVMSTTPYLDATGRYEGALAFVTDLTERRALHLKIQHTQKLESLGVLAGGIAHDFNNLLVSVLGNVGVAQLALPAESPALPALADIETAAHRAAELTRQMLAYAGKGRFVVQPLDLNRVIVEMLHLLQASVSKRAAFRFDRAANLPLILADAVQMRQVVMNLVTNASDALADDNGTITIVTGMQRADASYLGTAWAHEDLTEGDYVYLEVSDTGIGMSSETQARIFDPFFSTKFAGRGLGMAATLGILRGHRGAIKVYSEVGRGSTFKILLPVSKDAAAAEVPAEVVGTTLPRDGAKVLVVDDEATVVLVARRVLERAGFTVVSAEDGKAAVQCFREHGDFAVVLLDMTLPRMSGEEVFRELRLLQPNVRVVLSSGYNEQEATSRFVGKGLAGFLQKPWMAKSLLAAVDAALDGTSVYTGAPGD